MKELLLSFLVSFCSDYNITDTTKIQSIEFQIVKLYHVDGALAKSHFDLKKRKWIVQFDKETIDTNIDDPKVIELLVYHELGHVLLRLKDSKDKTFMNVNYLDISLSDRRYNKIKQNSLKTYKKQKHKKQ